MPGQGALADGQPAELRRLALDGTVQETLTVQDTTHIAGVEANGQGEVWCGGAAAPYEKGCLLLVCPR